MLNVIEPGSTVAHYQIVGRLGAGGMGEVYKALDTVLGRTVALKILPRHLVLNDERTRRFVQEARSASSLNHPGIVTIYEIGKAPLVPGSGGGVPAGEPIQYIAMELIEGVTLKHKIHNEPASLRTLVAVPTLLTGQAELLEQIERLEVHHLSGAGGDLAFALLADGLDADREVMDGDAPLLAVAHEAIARLNERYGPGPGGARFFMLHRRRVFNAGENIWMGW